MYFTKNYMKNNITYILVFGISILLIIFWGFSTLNTNFATPLSTCFAIIGTFVLVFPIKKIELKYTKFVFMSGPVFNVFLSFILCILYNKISSTLFPIYWLFFVTLFAFWVKNLSLKNFTFILTVALVYSFYLFPKTGLGKLNDNYQEILLKDDERCQPNYNYTLDEFLFLNHQLDTICFANLDKPVLVETWNETCSPCIKSIKEMEDELTNNPNFDVIYLYQTRGKKRLSNKAIFDYKFIKNKKNIYIDINGEFGTYMNLYTMPYYLMFNKASELVGTRYGYRSEHKETFSREIENLIIPNQTNL